MSVPEALRNAVASPDCGTEAEPMRTLNGRKVFETDVG